MYKGTKITLRAKLYKAKQKAGQKAVKAGAMEQCCEISQPTKFAGCEFSQPYKTFNDPSCSLTFLLQISSGLIMHLQIRLGFIVFESN